MDEQFDISGRIPGSLSLLDLEKDERDLLLDYMAKAYPRSYTDFIWSMMGDKAFLKFFDVLEGLTIKIPSRVNMARIVSNIKMYKYLEERNFSDDAYERATLIFKKRDVQLRKIVEMVDKALNGGLSEDEEDMEDELNYGYTGREDS